MLFALFGGDFILFEKLLVFMFEGFLGVFFSPIFIWISFFLGLIFI